MCLGHAALEADGDALSDLTSIGSANMEANDAVIVLTIDKDFSVSCALALSDLFVKGPLKRLESRVVSGDVGIAVSLLGLLLCQTDCSVLEWCEDSRWDAFIVHELAATSCQSCS